MLEEFFTNQLPLNAFATASMDAVVEFRRRSFSSSKRAIARLGCWSTGFAAKALTKLDSIIKGMFIAGN